MNKLAWFFVIPLAIIHGCSAPHPQEPSTRIDLPGIRADGRVMLPNQWSLRPAGAQMELGDLPVNIAVHPGGQFAAILHAGYSEHEIIIVDLNANPSTPAIRSHTPIEVAFYGLIFSPDGRHIFASGATRERIESFDFNDGQLANHKSIPLTATPEEFCVPAGMAVSRDGTTLLVACNRGHSILSVDLQSKNPPLKIAMPQESYPYAAIIDEPHGRAYVSLWGNATVAVLNWPIEAQASPIAFWPVQDHPNEMILTRDGGTLYVANANRNTVSALDTKKGKTLEILSSSLFPNAPDGSTPNAIALSPDEQTLYVANATNNNLAVLDVSKRGQSRSLGFIPVGWYPTSVRLTPDGRNILVANGKGGASKANPKGPSPFHKLTSTDEYIARLFRGTLSVIDVPNEDADRRTLTAQAYSCSPLRRDQAPVQSHPWGNPIPARVGSCSPIRYVIYIIKENRTYDQVLGDMPEGNGDPSLCLFGEDVTPNEHALAREFVLLDNFYVESEVSADGHEWSTGAYATDFVEKNWPLNYSDRSFDRVPYPSEGTPQIVAPSAGYIWDRCALAGLSYRSYGEFVEKQDDGTLRAKVTGLENHIDPEYQPYDLDYSDLDRAKHFIAELHRFESAGDMPRFQIMHLPNDHTCGSRIGKPTPTAMAAQNDLALGQIIDAVSHSKFWPKTAIFVVEDDAQSGADHIDAHRTTAFVISPHTRRGAIDSTLYSTTSMLRTMELILGLQPMSQFDAAARPMYASFQRRTDLQPYQAKPARVSLDSRNETTAWGADLSESLDLTHEDRADDLLFNEIIWRSVRGPDGPMPAPIRAAFMITNGEPEDDDDD